MGNTYQKQYVDLLNDTISYLKSSDLLSLRTPIKKQALNPIFRNQPSVDTSSIPTIKLSTEQPKKTPGLPPKQERDAVVEKKTPPVQEKPKAPDFYSTPSTSSSQLDLSEIKQSFLKLFPSLSLLETLPDDKRAKQIAERWRYKNQAIEISILHYKQTKEEKQLLENIAKALDIYFLPCRLIDAEPIEKENQWDFFLASDRLKIVISSDFCLFSQHQLMKYYKETPATSEYFLNEKPLFLLPALSLYLKTPLLKASLWKSLKQKIAPICQK